MGVESTCTKMKMLVGTLTEEILTVAALKDTEFENQDESDQYSIFGWIGPSNLRCKEPNALFGNQVTLRVEKSPLIPRCTKCSG